MSFRVSTAMIVGAYALLAGVLVLALGVDLLKPIATYAPQVTWLSPETTASRIAALRGAGRADVAGLYGLVISLSWGLIAALGAGGFGWGLANRGETVLGLDKMISYATLLVGLYAFSTFLTLVTSRLHLPLPRGGLSAVPALWFGTMIPSAAILARIGSMIAHDIGALIALAFEREREKAQAYVAATEEKRGQDSLDARVARVLAARRHAPPSN
ncbi:hypothetical protein ACFQ4O_12220 [Methylopila musalis]|uniref:Uncharacterized protein n=1 Tax=Methylopila musalis TaxID=1134781 RepID=A0ABW3ZAG2_9HYPH